jgi:hypothetical protein
MSAPSHELLTSFRYDPRLRSASWNTWRGNPPSPFFLLPFHLERLVSGAREFGWMRGLEALGVEPGKDVDVGEGIVEEDVYLYADALERFRILCQGSVDAYFAEHSEGSGGGGGGGDSEQALKVRGSVMCFFGTRLMQRTGTHPHRFESHSQKTASSTPQYHPHHPVRTISSQHPHSTPLHSPPHATLQPFRPLRRPPCACSSIRSRHPPPTLHSRGSSSHRTRRPRGGRTTPRVPEPGSPRSPHQPFPPAPQKCSSTRPAPRDASQTPPSARRSFTAQAAG